MRSARSVCVRRSGMVTSLPARDAPAAVLDAAAAERRTEALRRLATDLFDKEEQVQFVAAHASAHAAAEGMELG